MPLVSFDRLPDHARLWAFPASRALIAGEAEPFLTATDEFLTAWTAHRVPLATARDWRLNQFLLVAVDESAAGASGCSIDALVRFMRDAERRLGIMFTDNAPVWFRSQDGTVRSASRDEFRQLVERAEVSPGTIVFDNTIETAGALRAGRWEVPAHESWHGRAFFAGHSTSPK